MLIDAGCSTARASLPYFIDFKYDVIHLMHVHDEATPPRCLRVCCDGSSITPRLHTTASIEDLRKHTVNHERCPDLAIGIDS